MSDREQARPAHKVRFVTATTLFDGHDASINVFRRILQASGAEVIHLGHNRSGEEIVDAAVEEDAQAIAVTSYQGGHMEFFRYLRDLTVDRGAEHIRIFGGGGGTILPEEGEELAALRRRPDLLARRRAQPRSPGDGRRHARPCRLPARGARTGSTSPSWAHPTRSLVGRLVSAAENYPDKYPEVFEEIRRRAADSGAPVVGVTGTGGSGKSSLVDEVVRRYLAEYEDRTIAVVSVDPSRRRSGGALLGDRIRMNSIHHPRAYMRSLATRQPNLALSPHVQTAVDVVRAAGFDLVILETSGIGQSDTEIVDHCDLSVYVMTPEYGAATQLEKTDMLDYADLVAINKADKQGALDALRDVRKQVRRNRVQFDGDDARPAGVPHRGVGLQRPGDEPLLPGTHRGAGHQDRGFVPGELEPPGGPGGQAARRPTVPHPLPRRDRRVDPPLRRLGGGAVRCRRRPLPPRGRQIRFGVAGRGRTATSDAKTDG